MKTKEEIEQLAECQEDISNSWTKGCECKDSIGQTWCCNQCGLPYDTRKSKRYTEEMKTKQEIKQLAENKYPIKKDIYRDDMADNSKVTRFEVIDENGRVYTKHNCTIELSYQDDSRTLKVYIKQLNKQD
jgi:hypothetical protein